MANLVRFTVRQQPDSKVIESQQTPQPQVTHAVHLDDVVLEYLNTCLVVAGIEKRFLGGGSAIHFLYATLRRIKLLLQRQSALGLLIEPADGVAVHNVTAEE